MAVFLLFLSCKLFSIHGFFFFFFFKLRDRVHIPLTECSFRFCSACKETNIGDRRVYYNHCLVLNVKVDVPGGKQHGAIYPPTHNWKGQKYIHRSTPKRFFFLILHCNGRPVVFIWVKNQLSARAGLTCFCCFCTHYSPCDTQTRSVWWRTVPGKT